MRQQNCRKIFDFLFVFFGFRDETHGHALRPRLTAILDSCVTHSGFCVCVCVSCIEKSLVWSCRTMECNVFLLLSSSFAFYPVVKDGKELICFLCRCLLIYISDAANGSESHEFLFRLYGFMYCNVQLSRSLVCFSFHFFSLRLLLRSELQQSGRAVDVTDWWQRTNIARKHARRSAATENTTVNGWDRRCERSWSRQFRAQK